jgi:hypothetical protein
LLQSAYSDYQIRPFENLHQLVENTSLVVLGARLKIFLQYSLRFAYRLKRQLLISHCFFPIKKWLTGEADREIKSALRLSHQFLFRCWDLYFVMAFLFGPKMWGRFAGSEAKKVVRCLPVYGSDLTALLRTNLWRRIFRPASLILLPVRRGNFFETPARSCPARCANPECVVQYPLLLA